MTMAIEFAVPGAGGQAAVAGIFGNATSSLGSNSFAAALSTQLASSTNTETNRSGTAVNSSAELDSSSGFESSELDSNGFGLSRTGLSGSFGGKQPVKAANGKNSQSSSALSSSSSATSVTNLPSTLLPPTPVPNVFQENVVQEQAPLTQGLSASPAAGNSMMQEASSLNFAGEFFSESAGSSISSSPTLRPSVAATVITPSSSSGSGVLTAIHGGDDTAPLMATGAESVQTTGSQQNPQPTTTGIVVPTANGAAPSVAGVASDEISISAMDFSSLGLQGSDERTETSQWASGNGTASTLESVLPLASSLSSILSSASGVNGPITNAAATKNSLPAMTVLGVGTPTPAPATASSIPMQGEPVKAVFPGTVVPQGTPRTSAPVGSIPKSGGVTPSDLTAAIQTHVANTLAGSSLEMRAGVTLAVGPALDGIQSKASASALSPVATTQFAKSSPAAAAGTNPNGQTAGVSNLSNGSSPTTGSVQNLATSKNSAPGTPSATVSTSDTQANQITAIAAQTVAQTSSPQATAAALTVPTSQSSAGQQMPSATSPRPTNENLPSGASSSPSNLAAPGELAAAATVGPVQVAQIASKAAQTEMRIGMNTSAFGSVEVRTTVHANDVGVVIGSEKGDLRSLMSNDLPGIANTLQQQNLRLNQVSFQQGAAFSGNSFSGNSSGNGSQQNSFSSPQTVNHAGLSAEAGVDDSPLTMESAGGRATSLSILA
jgi:hypothetical protein